jgi:predicted AlkP superfamily pyrophosphatase or phosphodiesterase
MLLRIMDNFKRFRILMLRQRNLLLGFGLFGISAALLFAPGVPAQEQAPPLLVMISVDGLRPDYITEADAHGARVPNLRRFLKEGTYAEGVVGVVPTVTYPSHTTLVTGVWPAKHGIFANTTFDPLRQNQEGWYWYTEDIRVPTLWDVAAAAGRTTASIQWPVTVGAHITWDIPEFWRASTPDDAKLLRAVSTRGLLEEAKSELGEYRGGIDTAQGDENRGRYTEWILEKKHPALLTLHLSSLDHIEHETGPFSPEAIAVLETIDATIGKIRATAERLAPGRAYIAVVSDHGFVRTDAQLNLFPLFHDAKLITVNDKGKITDWKAIPWVTGGSAAIMLKDPNDAATVSQVRELLAKVASDPANGIDRILEADDVHKRGGYPPASFFVGLKPGWRTGSTFDGAVLSKPKTVGGTHGALPDLPDLHASFFLIGPHVPAGKSLGTIDMRDVAPTLAHEVGLALPNADGKTLLP